MQDLVYVASLFVFFAIAALFVVACDKIIGSDEDALAEAERGAPTPPPDTMEQEEKVAA
jgi:hypothetical protein